MKFTLRGKRQDTLSSKNSDCKTKQSSILNYIYDEELGEYVTVPPPFLSFSTEIESERKSKGVNGSRCIGESTESDKKPVFERVWGKDEEVNLLEALVEYTQNKHGGPVSTPFDMSQFYTTLDQSFHQKFTRTQMANKVRKLKQKFKKNIGRKQEKIQGKALSSSKLHDFKLFQLSKKIWSDGDESLNVQNTPSNNLYFDGLEDFVRQNGLSLNILDEKDKVTLEKKWNDFKFSEWVTFSRKAILTKELMEQALNAYGEVSFS